MKPEDLDKQVRAYEERMEAKRKAEEQAEADEAERQRQAYLKRTGRKEMEP